MKLLACHGVRPDVLKLEHAVAMCMHMVGKAEGAHHIVGLHAFDSSRYVETDDEERCIQRGLFDTLHSHIGELDRPRAGGGGRIGVRDTLAHAGHLVLAKQPEVAVNTPGLHLKMLLPLGTLEWGVCKLISMHAVAAVRYFRNDGISALKLMPPEHCFVSQPEL